MAENAQTYRVEVLADDAPPRAERLTHTLRGNLIQLNDVSVDFSGNNLGTAASKASTFTYLALFVVSSSSSKLLIIAITEWDSKERHRKVCIARLIPHWRSPVKPKRISSSARKFMKRAEKRMNLRAPRQRALLIHTESYGDERFSVPPSSILTNSQLTKKVLAHRTWEPATRPECSAIHPRTTCVSRSPVHRLRPGWFGASLPPAMTSAQSRRLTSSTSPLPTSTSTGLPRPD